MFIVMIDTVLIFVGVLAGLVAILVLYGRRHERWSSDRRNAADTSAERRRD